MIIKNWQLYILISVFLVFGVAGILHKNPIIVVQKGILMIPGSWLFLQIQMQLCSTPLNKEIKYRMRRALIKNYELSDRQVEYYLTTGKLVYTETQNGDFSAVLQSNDNLNGTVGYVMDRTIRVYHASEGRTMSQEFLWLRENTGDTNMKFYQYKALKVLQADDERKKNRRKKK